MLRFLIVTLLFAMCGAVANVGFQPNQYIVADPQGNKIVVLDSNLQNVGVLDGAFANVRGLDLDYCVLNGNLVAASQGGVIREYTSSGSKILEITNVNKIVPVDVKLRGTSIFVDGFFNGISQFNRGNGALVRTFAAGNSYKGLAVVPAGELWGARQFANFVDVFDTTTGQLIRSINVNNNDQSSDVEALFYSRTTNTVLMCDSSNGVVFERNLDGSFVRRFDGGACAFGVTRGANGDVLATASFNRRIHRWLADGTYMGSTSISSLVGSIGNIVWTGNIVPDNTPPTIVCPNNVIKACPNSKLPDPKLLVDSAAWKQTGGATNPFPPGPSTIEYSAFDGCGNSASCTFQVFGDFQPPSIQCPANRIVCAGSRLMFNIVPNDNCGIAQVRVLNGLTSGSVVPIGVTTTTVEAVDTSGQRSSCSFTVEGVAANGSCDDQDPDTIGDHCLETFCIGGVSSSNDAVVALLQGCPITDNFSFSYANGRKLCTRISPLCKDTRCKSDVPQESVSIGSWSIFKQSVEFDIGLIGFINQFVGQYVVKSIGGATFRLYRVGASELSTRDTVDVSLSEHFIRFTDSSGNVKVLGGSAVSQALNV